MQGESWTDDQILIVLIWCLLLLLKRAHEPLSGDHFLFDLGQMHLYQQPFHVRLRVPDFGDAVPGSSDPNENFPLHGLDGRSDHELVILHVPRGASGEVGLVLLTLCVREIGALIRVERKAETAFQGT